MPLPTFLPLLAAAGLLTPGLLTPPPESVLTLTVENVGAANLPDMVQLTCGPDEGTHPTPGLACTELLRVDGDVHKVGDTETACTDHIENPKRATARGHWQGRVIDEELYFGNPCEFATRAGHVFRIDGE
ncbi:MULTISPECIES: SSI family serine proteinase inhibitor [unclassified Crossiella]|uniref:SSI family serine proteinase inhibitor n=1 Tax=unclassified Crossiella TaxID=2620835 RepID=UPI00200016D2|nr:MULTISPECIES: SSI family serine proteinase inhibitor [unclassified Crossiella]MCK2243976.1 SSI family serine proteinase inhibitor [Crossiella sp. S99.2]MCK2257166.1 SSI family serine proteinase inhibitor [Crossiella sp. S99.1]